MFNPYQYEDEYDDNPIIEGIVLRRARERAEGRENDKHNDEIKQIKASFAAALQRRLDNG